MNLLQRAHDSEGTEFDRAKAEEINSSLDEWRGMRAQVWEYTVSHGLLQIRLTRPGSENNVHVRCMHCSHISGPMDWTNACLQIAHNPQGDQNPRFLVFDVGSAFMLTCYRVDLFENVEPLYLIPET